MEINTNIKCNKWLELEIKGSNSIIKFDVDTLREAKDLKESFIAAILDIERLVEILNKNNATR